MNEEGLFCKLFPEYAVNGKPLHPYFDLFESGYEQAENRIEGLESQIEKLKGDLELWESGACRATNLDKCGVVKELEAQIEKMKCCGNCKHFDFNEPNYCHKGVYRKRQYVCSKWEFME